MLKIISNILYFIGLLSVIIVFPGTWIVNGFLEALQYLIFGLVAIIITFLIDKIIDKREGKGKYVFDYGNKIYWYLGSGVLLIFVFVCFINKKYSQGITLFFLSISLFATGRKSG